MMPNCHPRTWEVGPAGSRIHGQLGLQSELMAGLGYVRFCLKGKNPIVIHKQLKGHKIINQMFFVFYG